MNFKVLYIISSQYGITNTYCSHVKTCQSIHVKICQPIRDMVYLYMILISYLRLIQLYKTDL